VLSGLLRSQDSHGVTLRTVTEEVVIARSDIVKQEVAPVSMMPDGLMLTLQPDQVRDLIAYLMHPAQVDLPK
jgi:putative heme-binding domain-containing protein